MGRSVSLAARNNANAPATLRSWKMGLKSGSNWPAISTICVRKVLIRPFGFMRPSALYISSLARHKVSLYTSVSSLSINGDVPVVQAGAELAVAVAVSAL